jgi:hypothetical protein
MYRLCRSVVYFDLGRSRSRLQLRVFVGLRSLTYVVQSVCDVAISCLYSRLVGVGIRVSVLHPFFITSFSHRTSIAFNTALILVTRVADLVACTFSASCVVHMLLSPAILSAHCSVVHWLLAAQMLQEVLIVYGVGTSCLRSVY